MNKSEELCSDNLYAVSIKEDTAYLCLHFTRNHEDLKPYTPYPAYSIRRIEDQVKNILEYYNRGPYSKKPPIRLNKLDYQGDLGSTNDVLIPLMLSNFEVSTWAGLLNVWLKIDGDEDNNQATISSETRVASVPKDVAGYVKDATMGSVSDKTKMAKDAAECIKCIKFYLVVGMLKQKLKFQKRYLIHFDKVPRNAETGLNKGCRLLSVVLFFQKTVAVIYMWLAHLTELEITIFSSEEFWLSYIFEA
ncbi:hypothetical protein Tco_0185575 [Tanacetum coccineum]